MLAGVLYGIDLLLGILVRFALITGYVYLAIRTLQYFGVTI